MEMNQTPELSRYYAIIKRRWLPAAAVCGTVILLTGVYTFTAQPIYEPVAQLLIKQKSDTSSLLSGLTDTLGQLDGASKVSNPVDTETTIIRSAPLLHKVIDAQKLKDKDGATLTYDDFLANLRIVNDLNTDVLEVFYRDTNPKRGTDVVNTLVKFYIANNISSNREATAAARNFLEEQIPKVESTVRLAELNLRKFKEANKIVDLAEEGQASVTVIGGLETQISTNQGDLQALNARSRALQAKLGMTAQDALTLSDLSQSPSVQAVLTEVKTLEDQLAVQRTRYQENSPTIISLKSKEVALRTLLQERVREVLGTRANSRTNLQLGALSQSLVEDFVKSEVDRMAMVSRVDSLGQVRNAYKQRLTILPKLEQGQRQLDRQLKAAQTTYETLLGKLQEIRVAENLDVGNVSVISPARLPDDPVYPKKFLFMAAGALAGTVLGILTALILELRDRSVKTVSDALLLFGYPLLGTIPTFDKQEGTLPGKRSKSLLGKAQPTLPAASPSAPFTAPAELVVKEYPRSAPSESFRMLLSNINFLSSDKPIKVIVISSCLPGEGKTTVSANLATCMAQMGRRVIVIDADMRRPYLHNCFGIPNKRGLSNVLVGESTLEASILPLEENLDVIPSGQMPPDPVALVSSKRMEALISGLAETYDFVLIDTPPLSLTAESMILARMGDGVLLVTRPGVVDAEIIAQCKRSLVQAGPKVLGMVINGVIPENESSIYYQYYNSSYYGSEKAGESPKS